MTASATTTCPACGAAASGKFCSNCGASLEPRRCAGCGTDLTPTARFCHRCGRPAAGGAGGAPVGPGAAGESRTPWIVAGVLSTALLVFIALWVWRDQSARTVPDMANPGAVSASGIGGGGPATSGPAPDISQMSPRERYDRLFNRIMTAAERGDSTEVLRFTPMALGAYAQLDTIDADARYHAAVLRLQVGEFDEARALADTILAETPGHLFAYLIRGTAAELLGDRAALAAARRDFLARYDTEIRAGRAEYGDHKPVLDNFKRDAEAAR